MVRTDTLTSAAGGWLKTAFPVYAGPFELSRRDEPSPAPAVSDRTWPERAKRETPRARRPVTASSLKRIAVWKLQHGCKPPRLLETRNRSHRAFGSRCQGGLGQKHDFRRAYPDACGGMALKTVGPASKGRTGYVGLGAGRLRRSAPRTGPPSRPGPSWTTGRCAGCRYPWRPWASPWRPRPRRRGCSRRA